MGFVEATLEIPTDDECILWGDPGVTDWKPQMTRLYLWHT